MQAGVSAAATGSMSGVQRHGGHRGGMRQEAMTALAGALGMDESDVSQARSTGQSVAKLAESKGVSLDKVKDALLKDVQQRLTQDHQSGRLSQQQYDNLTQGASSFVD